MRFCLVSTQQDLGGGEALLMSIARELATAGHDIAWIVRDKGAVLERLESEQQNVLHRLRNRGINWGDLNSVIHQLRTWQPQVLILNDTHAVPIAGSAAWFCRSAKPLRLAYKHTVFPLRSKLKYRLFADHMICVSQAARLTLLEGGMADERCQVIYGGCQPREIDSEQRALTRRALGIEPGERMLVSVGSLLECKGHADLIDAFPAVLQVFPKTRLWIAGDGDQRQTLEAQIERFGLQRSVRLLGHRSDADDLIASADLLVHPSHAEGLSLVLIQAQMLEKPIVATAVGGTVEVMHCNEPEKCTSWIVPPRDPASLTAVICNALSKIDADPQGLAHRLIETARLTREQFDIRLHARHLADLCTNLLAKRGTG
jgi:L-malate glycosyltransferase